MKLYICRGDVGTETKIIVYKAYEYTLSLHVHNQSKIEFSDRETQEKMSIIVVSSNG